MIRHTSYKAILTHAPQCKLATPRSAKKRIVIQRVDDVKQMGFALLKDANKSRWHRRRDTH
jgi:hypothetical protein